jgi:hypothetical protein
MDVLDNPSLNALTNGSTSLIPESLITTITIGFIVLNVLGLLFLVAYIAGLMRKWKVQSAVLHMQKDLADIKVLLQKPTSSEPIHATGRVESSSNQKQPDSTVQS